MAGLFHLLRGDAPGGAILNPMVFMQSWLDDHPSSENQGAETENNVFLSGLRPPASVEPLDQKVQQGDAAADVLKDEITIENDLRHRPGVKPRNACVLGNAKQGQSFRGKEHRSHRKGEKQSGAKPKRGVQAANKSYYGSHAVTLEKKRNDAKRFIEVAIFGVASDPNELFLPGVW